MTFPESQKRTSPIVYLIIIILPFLLFYWMAPFITEKSIGADYQTTSIENQMELLFSIKASSFPLYAPGFALGHSASALTLGQVFHPLPHIASLLPGYWEGKSLECITLLRLISLGLTHLALFVFLRNLKINTLFSFILSCITIYNLRMLDLFRYGAALENYTGFILLCTAIGWYFVDHAKYRGPICIIASTYLLICGGHPQMMYYGLLGAGLFLLIIPFVVSTMLPEVQSDLKAVSMFWLQVVICLTLGLLLSLAYILPFYFEFIATNVERVNQGYRWADSIRDTFLGTINSFFLPFRSDIHGTFGGSSIIIMAVSLPVLRFFRKIPIAIWSAWGVSLFVFLYMQGARTPVHQLVWEYLPFASSFRYSGRITLIMPMFLMMVLAWVIKAEPFSVRLNNRSVELTPATILAISSLILTIAYLLLLSISYLFTKIEFSPFAPVSIRSIPKLSETFLILFGLSSLSLLGIRNRLPNATKTLGIIICLTTLLQVGISLKYGTWDATRKNRPTFEQMGKEKRESLSYRFYPGTGMYSSIVTTQQENSFMEPFLGKVYYQSETVSGPDNAYARMLKGRTPQQIFIEGMEVTSPQYSSDQLSSEVELIYSSYNKLQFRIQSSVPAIFGMSYPYTGHWKASINGADTHVYRANGSAHAINIPEGESLVEFRYSSPYFFWGVFISCLTFSLITIFISIRTLSSIQRVVAIIFFLCLGSSIFLSWHHSLYTGNNLETYYVWEYEPPLSNPNLAYGKRTMKSSRWRGSPGYLHSSLAVDGERGQGTGFTTAPQKEPTWSVDLNRVEKIRKIDIYESPEGPSTNQRPLNISFSEDRQQWRSVVSLSSAAKPNVPQTIFLEKPVSARYIQIQASGHTILKLDEVEVYGP